jgi:hypothetical protein
MGPSKKKRPSEQEGRFSLDYRFRHYFPAAEPPVPRVVDVPVLPPALEPPAPSVLELEPDPLPAAEPPVPIEVLLEPWPALDPPAPMVEALPLPEPEPPADDPPVPRVVSEDPLPAAEPPAPIVELACANPSDVLPAMRVAASAAILIVRSVMVAFLS